MMRLDFPEKLEYDNQPEVVSWQSIAFEIPIKQINIAVTKSKHENRKLDIVCSKHSEVWAGFTMSVASDNNRLNNKC